MNMKEAKEVQDLYLMQQAYATLFVTANKVQARSDRCFKNITSRQFMLVIAVLHLKEDDTTLNNIASKLGTSKQNVNTIVNGVVKKGYLEVVPSPKDKRAVNVKITDAIKVELLSYSDASINFLKNIFNKFTNDEVEILWKLLKKLYEYDGVKQDGFEDDIKVDLSLDNL